MRVAHLLADACGLDIVQSEDSRFLSRLHLPNVGHADAMLDAVGLRPLFELSPRLRIERLVNAEVFG